jgi:hypothetical protein
MSLSEVNYEAQKKKNVTLSHYLNCNEFEVVEWQLVIVNTVHCNIIVIDVSLWARPFILKF